MPVRQGLQDFYLASEVIEQFRTEAGPTDSLDGYLTACLLHTNQSDASTARVV